MRNRGSILIAVVFIMIVLILMGITGVAMLMNQSHTSLNVMRVAQGHAVRQGVAEFLKRRLQYDVDWANLANETITFDGMQTEVTYANRGEGVVDVSTVTTATLSDVEIIRKQKFRLKRLPSSAHFMLFRGADNDADWTIGDSTLTSGDIYSNGDALFVGSTLTDGKFYTSVSPAPAGQISVPDPQPRMPVYDTAGGQAGLMAGYDSEIATMQGSGSVPDEDASDVTISGTLTLAPGPSLDCRDLILKPGALVRGSGKIIAWRAVYLNDRPPGACELTDGMDFYTSDGGCKKADTGLVWGARQADLLWANANAYCGSSSEGGFSGWKLPSTAELQNAAGVVGAPYFNFVENADFWSSATSQTETVNLSSGTVSDHPATPMPFVCVRASTNVDKGLVRIQPTTGKITILAGHSILKTDDTSSLSVLDTVYQSIFYARTAPAGEARLTASAYSGITTVVRDSAVMARSLIYVGPRVDLLHSHVFMPSGKITIEGDGTTGGRPEVVGIVASTSASQPSIRIHQNVYLNGLAYSSNGGVLIDDLSGTASILSNHYSANLIQNLSLNGSYEKSLIYNNNELLLPNFIGSVSSVSGTWEAD